AISSSAPAPKAEKSMVMAMFPVAASVSTVKGISAVSPSPSKIMTPSTRAGVASALVAKAAWRAARSPVRPPPEDSVVDGALVVSGAAVVSTVVATVVSGVVAAVVSAALVVVSSACPPQAATTTARTALINMRRFKGFSPSGDQGKQNPCRPVYPRIENGLPGASAASAASASPAAGEASAASAGTTRAGRAERTGESRLQAGEGVLATASGVAVGAVPVDVGLFDQFGRGVEAGVLQHLGGDTERHGVDEVLVPQLEGDRRRLFETGEVPEVSAERPPGRGHVGPGPGPLHGHPPGQDEEEEHHPAEDQADRDRQRDRPRVGSRRRHPRGGEDAEGAEQEEPDRHPDHHLAPRPLQELAALELAHHRLDERLIRGGVGGGVLPDQATELVEGLRPVVEDPPQDRVDVAFVVEELTRVIAELQLEVADLFLAQPQEGRPRRLDGPGLD